MAIQHSPRPQHQLASKLVITAKKAIERNAPSDAILAILLFLAIGVKSQIPTEVPIYGTFTLQPGMYNIKGVSPAGTGTSSTFGSLLSFRNTVYRDNYYAEATTDIPAGWIIGGILNGFGNSPSIYNITLDNFDESALPSTLEEGDYDLVFVKANILGVSQSFKVFDDFMLGYHVAWDGINSGVINKDREAVALDGALNLNYWNFAPVISYQNDIIRVEAKYLFNRAKTIEKGREIRLTGDYFIANDAETLGLSIGAFVNTLNITTTDKRPNVGEINMFAAGIRISFIYPSVWSLF